MPVKLQLAVTWSTSSFWIAGGRFSSVIWASLLLLLVMVLWLVTLTNLYVSVTVLTLCDFGMTFSSFFNTVLLLCCCCGCCTLNACENNNNHPPAQINERTQTINLLKMWYLKQNKKNKKKRHKETKLKAQKWCTHYRTETTSAWLDLTWWLKKSISKRTCWKWNTTLHATPYTWSRIAWIGIHTDILFKDKTTLISSTNETTNKEKNGKNLPKKRWKLKL